VVKVVGCLIEGIDVLRDVVIFTAMLLFAGVSSAQRGGLPSSSPHLVSPHHHPIPSHLTSFHHHLIISSPLLLAGVSQRGGLARSLARTRHHWRIAITRTPTHASHPTGAGQALISLTCFVGTTQVSAPCSSARGPPSLR
jgi:hypothetical protein